MQEFYSHNSFNIQYPSPTDQISNMYHQSFSTVSKPKHEVITPIVDEPVLEIGLCGLCEKHIEMKKEGKKLQCLHTFCRPCLVNSIKTNKEIRICCPLPADKCDKDISDAEIESLFGEAEFQEIMTGLMMRISKVIEDNREKEKAAKLVITNLEKMDQQNFNENTEMFECPVCSLETEIGTGVILKNCSHQICKECINSTIQFSEHIEVKCPFMDDDGSCDKKIQDREIRSLATKEVFEKYLEKSLNSAEVVTENAYHCKTPNCNGWVVYDADVHRFACQVCSKINCITCKVIHHGKTCEEYLDEINPNARNVRELLETEMAMKALVASGQAMHCPQCGIIVEKADGCDYLTCTVCKLAICWITRKPRRDLIKGGVLIQGCNCRVNGVRCHPDCGNCH